MELITLIEMVGYRAGHAVDQNPFRCVMCEHLTKHAGGDIIRHIASAHNIPETELSIDKDGNVFRSPGDWPSCDRAGQA